MQKEYKVEICTNSVESCIEAEKGGAQRVELCAGIPEGGTTPSYGEIFVARASLKIKLHVIIRPRGGDFLYSSKEHQTMLKDIEMARILGVDGIVIGSLTQNGEIDMLRNKELVEAAEGLSVTFHRAFDMCRNPQTALEQLIELGCQRVLSSGQEITAFKGITLLKELVDQANNRIIVMPGCGINESNIAEIAQRTGAKEFHFSARKKIQSKMEFRNSKLSMGATVVETNEFERNVSSAERISASLAALYRTQKGE